MSLILTELAAWRALRATPDWADQRIGFVPTMGALHDGHLELVRQAVAACDLVVASVFVNPQQFNNAADLAAYPRVPEEDARLLASAGCHILFLPTVAEMYPVAPRTGFAFGAVEQVLEGAHRPGHFSGVGLVVTKLFHLVEPHAAWFGQKDLQQVAVVRQLVRDLDFDLELVVASTVRESDGLAMSSRNRRLSAEDRAVAPVIYQALSLTRTALLNGATVAAARGQGEALIADTRHFRPEYFAVVDAETLQALPDDAQLPPTETAVVVAAWLGEVRLIDNVVVPPAVA